jgi:hypothetical protein
LDKETYLSRKISLEQSIESAKQTLVDLKANIAAIEEFPDQLESIEQLASITQEAFEEGIPPEEFRQLVEALDVKLELSIVDGERWLKASCIIDASLLPVVYWPTLKEKPLALGDVGTLGRHAQFGNVGAR